MSRLIFRVVLIAGLLTGLLLLLRPPQPPPEGRPATRPWEVQVDGRGGSRAFGLELGVATLAEAERRLGSEAEVTLFQQADGGLVLEAFFDDLAPGGLKADFVLVLDLAAADLAALHARGLRIARGRDGIRRVQLDPLDLPLARAAPIVTITYLPAIDLDPEALARRFGPPAERVAEGPGVTHWLYPALGLDIVVAAGGKEVLQYVAPRRFERLAAPLRAPDTAARP